MGVNNVVKTRRRYATLVFLRGAEGMNRLQVQQCFALQDLWPSILLGRAEPDLRI